MIISIVKAEPNNRAETTLKDKYKGIGCQHYPNVDLSKMEREELFIIDLTCDGEFQALLAPKKLAEFLIKKGLPEKVTKINLLVSDVNPAKQLLPYATQLIEALTQGGRSVDVAVPSDLSSGITILCPPPASGIENDWRVYGISVEDYETMKRSDTVPKNYGEYDNCVAKKLIWHGTDIDVWLNDVDRVVKAQAENHFRNGR